MASSPLLHTSSLRFALGLWAGRISCSADESGHILTLSYSGHIRPAEMKKALQSVQALAPRLKPGFVVLSDLTNLDSMEPACAADLGSIAEQLSSYGISSVIRVIPDPAKDIGFNIVSIFHFRQPIKVHTRDNLAEAIKCLLLTECAAVTADS
jgi:hypothetical protein